MIRPLPQPFLDVLGAEVVEHRALHGGDLSEVSYVRLSDGREMVAKRGPLVDAEARMLAALRLVHAPVPEILHVEHGLLVLEYLPEVKEADPAAWKKLGEELALLHSYAGSAFGWEEDYALGGVTVENAQSDNWPAFWANRRLRPALPHLPEEIARRVSALADSLPDRLPTEPKASLLHGDLWSGNVLFTSDRAVLIDPACYYGHAEVDLAMLTLFYAPEPAFWRGYGRPEADREAREPIYQLFPALTHYRLFGDRYAPMVTRLLDAAGV